MVRNDARLVPQAITQPPAARTYPMDDGTGVALPKKHVDQAREVPLDHDREEHVLCPLDIHLEHHVVRLGDRGAQPAEEVHLRHTK